jgi:hypothetical protein
MKVTDFPHTQLFAVLLSALGGRVHSACVSVNVHMSSVCASYVWAHCLNQTVTYLTSVIHTYAVSPELQHGSPRAHLQGCCLVQPTSSIWRWLPCSCSAMGTAARLPAALPVGLAAWEGGRFLSLPAL